MVQGTRSEAEVSAPSGWADELRVHSERGLGEVGRRGYMEIQAELAPLLAKSQRELLDAMREACIHTFGWPIGLVMDGAQQNWRPRPTSDGVVTEVAISEADDGLGRSSYDFWKVFQDGRFYTLLSLFEDDRAEQRIFVDTRINRVTEAMMLLVRLYRRLDASDTDRITIRIRHDGLSGRQLGVANTLRATWHAASASEPAVDTTVVASLLEIETDLPRFVREVVRPLFMNFDFYEVPEDVVNEISEGFMAGEVK